jgi:hypothetical protein
MSILDEDPVSDGASTLLPEPSDNITRLVTSEVGVPSRITWLKVRANICNDDYLIVACLLCIHP